MCRKNRIRVDRTEIRALNLNDRPAKEESRPPGYLSIMPRRFPILESSVPKLPILSNPSCWPGLLHSVLSCSILEPRPSALSPSLFLVSPPPTHPLTWTIPLLSCGSHLLDVDHTLTSYLSPLDHPNICRFQVITFVNTEQEPIIFLDERSVRLHIGFLLCYEQQWAFSVMTLVPEVVLSFPFPEAS